MAKVTSGSFNSSSYSGRYYTISWSATQDTAKNQSTISWKIEAKGGSSSYYAERKVELIIDGVSVYSKSDKVHRYKGTVSSGTTTITHNTNGSRSFTASFKAAVYYETVNCTGSGTWELTDIPRAATITECSDFADNTTSVTIKYNNVAGNNVEAVEACIATYSATAGYWVANGADYRAVNKTGTLSYKFDFTKEPLILTNLRKLVTASDGKLKIKFYLRTTIDGTYYYNSVEKTFSLTDFTPTLNPTVKDVGSLSVLLTGNENKFIKYYNVLEFNSGAVARKEATIKSQKVTCGNNSKNSGTGQIGYVDNNQVTFSVTDSRNNTTTQTVTLDMINYKKLTCRATANIGLVGETTSAITFTVNGDYWSGDFGAVENELKLCYRLKPNKEEYGEEVEFIPTINASKGTYSFNGTIGNLDYQTTYTLQIIAYDKVFSEGISSAEIVLNTTPIFYWNKEEFNFNTPTVTVCGGNVLTETVLYNNTSGTNETVTLAASVNNFTYLDIFYTDNNGSGAGYVRVYQPNGKSLHLSLIESIANYGFYVRHTNYTVNDNKITPNTATATYNLFNGTTWSNAGKFHNFLKIKRVVGVK